jgi:hypothetical protein
MMARGLFLDFFFFQFVLKGLGLDVGWAGFDTSTVASDGLCFRPLFSWVHLLDGGFGTMLTWDIDALWRYDNLVATPNTY